MSRGSAGQANLQNILAERSVIGAMLKSTEAYWQVRDILRTDDFTLDKHRQIYTVISDLCEEGKKVSLSLVEARLPDAFEDGTDSAPYIWVLASDAASEELVPVDFADELTELGSRRRIKATAEAMIKHVAAGSKHAGDIVALAEVQLQDSISSSTMRRPMKIGKVIETVMSRSGTALQSGVLAGYGTGLISLDEIMGTMRATDLIFIEGSQGDGKTALAAQMAAHMAQTAPVLFIEMEMSQEDLAGRELAWESKMTLETILDGNLQMSEYEALLNAKDRFQDKDFFILDEKSMTIKQIRSQALSFKRRYGRLGALFIDQLDKIKAHGRHSNKFDRLAEVTGDLKDLAKDLECVIVCLAQRTRGAQRRDSDVPQINDADAPSIERDADCIIAAWRRDNWLRLNPPPSKSSGEVWESYNRDIRNSENVASIICLKRRKGKAFQQRQFRWIGDLTRYAEMSQDDGI